MVLSAAGEVPAFVSSAKKSLTSFKGDTGLSIAMVSPGLPPSCCKLKRASLLHGGCQLGDINNPEK